MSKKLKNPAKLARPVLPQINYAFQRTVSYSQYSTFRQCPHKWYLKSVEKIKDSPSIHMVFGAAMHYVLQMYITEIYKTSGVQADKLELEEIFEQKFADEYGQQYDNNKHVHFSNALEMREFFDDGVEIILWFKKHRKEYFTTRNCYLLGVEIPLQFEIRNNIIYKGFIDLAIYDVDLDKITIYDFKTSTRGWGEEAKKDDGKLSQLVLYKTFFSELYKYDIEKIDVEFLVLKRKVVPNEWSENPKRVQLVRPAAGKIKIRKATQNFYTFIKECFDEEGFPIRKEHEKKISKLCDFCIHNNTVNCIK